ncbi:hypothetical protein E0F15_14650 [Frankia sp. B2]|nr:hypothetical protein [Frankia sp. CgIS1]TFE28770.1 hypothetical protein E0F15_14650 [Frankia sp. B2]
MIPTVRLAAGLAWADNRARPGGGWIRPQTLADRLQAPREQVAAWMATLTTVGIMAEQRTGAGRAYRFAPRRDVPPLVRRPVDAVRRRELWAALTAAQTSGPASTERIARVLDAETGRVDREELALRLATLAARRILAVDAGCWRYTTAGAAASTAALARPLDSADGWSAIAATRPPVFGAVDMDDVAHRLGLSMPRLRIWCQEQEDAGLLRQLVGGGWAVTDMGRTRIPATPVAAAA